MKQDFIIYTRMLEVVLWSFEKANTFPKKQRFVLGQQIENSALCALRLIIEANNSRDSGVVREKLQNLNVELEVMRSLYRVAFEIKFIKAASPSVAELIKPHSGQLKSKGAFSISIALWYNLDNVVMKTCERDGAKQ